MAYLIGVVLFALAIFISVALHEAGHMATAKAFGMKVTRYFVGFGPTLFSFRRGETEYGLKAIPAGAFVKIVGMTPQDDDVAPEDEPKAMWRYPVWKRTIVMSAGSIMHFILGFVVLWVTLFLVGVPNPDLNDQAKVDALPATVSIENCVQLNADRTNCLPSDPQSPARQAGLQNGDKITAVNGTQVATYIGLVNTIRAAKPGPATLTFEHAGVTKTANIDLVAAPRHPADNPSGPPTTVAALGVSQALPSNIPTTVTYGPIESIGQSGRFTGQLFEGIGSSLKTIPSKIPNLWDSLSGKPRDPNGPISVVGATRLGGESVQHGAWTLFLSFLISLNFFIGVFNLLPLLPLDGGHIAISWFERVRSWFYAKIGRRDPGRVDYLKLMPITYAVILVFGGFTLLTVAADIINPVTLFGN
ncbi:M50 family metallopeptidase [Rugosimonospora acidiphila]|uniref:M50 family metallopeptidase n=1 Tax=Rugosimonospora acidiphila TaxID=556531 RepID=A0ABP9RPJ7_9ACTN